MVEEAKGNQPVFKVRFGAVSGALWVNSHKVDGKDVNSLSATFQKYYKTKSGEDKNTGSFGVNDLPKLGLCVQAVYAEAVCNRAKLLEE
jgi:hypothetical protein